MALTEGSLRGVRGGRARSRHRGRDLQRAGAAERHDRRAQARPGRGADAVPDGRRRARRRLHRQRPRLLGRRRHLRRDAYRACAADAGAGDPPRPSQRASAPTTGCAAISQPLNTAVRDARQADDRRDQRRRHPDRASRSRCACDFRIASTSARLGSATLRFGLLPDEGGQYLLVQLLGVARAMDFLMRKRIVTAARRRSSSAWCTRWSRTPTCCRTPRWSSRASWPTARRSRCACSSARSTTPPS